MIAELTALINSTKAAYEIAQGVNALKADVDRGQAISKILEILLSVQKDAIGVNVLAQNLQEEKQQLIQKIKEYEEWAEIESQYELKEIATSTFVYSYKGDNSKPAHWLCPKCYQEKKTYIMQLYHSGNTGKEYKCDNCNTIIKLRGSSGYKPPSAPRGGGWMGS